MTKKATKTGKELERRVANAYREMGAWKVEHDVELAGNQIDVYVELKTPGRLLHRIAVEAKDRDRAVGIKIVNDFAQIVDLLRRAHWIDEGIIVSATGFSKQARNAAKEYGIRLLEPTDLDAMVVEAKAPGEEAAPPPPPEEQPPPTALPTAQTALDRWRSFNVAERVAIIGLVGTIAAAFITLCGMLGSPVIEQLARSGFRSPTVIAIATPTPTLTSTVTPSLTSTWTPAPTITHPSTLTPMPSEEVLIEIDGVIIDVSDDRCREIICNSSPRIQVTMLDSAGVSLQPDIFSYNWRFDPPDLHNPDRLDSKNYAIIYSVPCDRNNQTVTIEVLKDGETLYVRSVRFNIKKQP